MNLKTAFAIGGSATTMLRHALCVFPLLLSLNPNENPFSRASSVREKMKKRSLDKNREKCSAQSESLLKNFV